MNFFERLIGNLAKATISKTDHWKTPAEPFPARWRAMLLERVPFYNALSAEEKQEFEQRMHRFMINVRFTGIQVEVKEIDKVLVAASAIITIFGFKNWHYPNVYEILLYANAFDERFHTEGDKLNTLGMVGSGAMNGKMALSIPAIHQGFDNESDGNNTAIHEFVHLLERADQDYSSLPTPLVEKQYVLPWLDMIQQNIYAINTAHSDIRPYGGTNPKEFFAVAGEYFFERPDLMAERHPELYAMLARIFHQDMKERLPKMKRVHIGRNDPCPCGSGKKFKKCCGAVHE